MNERKRILWLVSWYPNRNDRFDGDFIQRHARAAAIADDVHVIFVTQAELSASFEEEMNYATGLTEQLIYFNSGSPLADRFRRPWLWGRYFQQAVKAYIKKFGRPHAVHVHIPWKAGLIALWIKRKWGIPYLITEHWGMYEPKGEESFYKKSLLARTLLKRIYKEASQCTAVSKYLAKGIRKFTGSNCMILPNVVDTSLFHPGDEKYSRFSFIHVSNMAPVKNTGLVLEAFRQLLLTTPYAQLILIGNRDQSCVRQAEESGILNRSVFFRGEISYREVADEMRRAHCLVMASWSETFSCVTAEALCTGIPVIATSVGAFPELVVSGKGLLVRPGDSLALMKAMSQVLDQYASYDTGKIASEATAAFSYSSISEQFRSLYRDGRKFMADS